MSADYTRNVSSSSSNNMHHVSSSSSKQRPVSIIPNMSIQNMSNWSNLVNMNMASMANMSNMSYPMMRPSVMVKQRKTNFTQREVDALINSVRQHQDTVLFGVAGGPGWAKAWTQVAAAVSGVEGIVRSEGDVRKKWTYLKWEAKNTSKPDRDSTSRAVLQILTSRQSQIDAANQHAASLRADMRLNEGLRGAPLSEAVQSSRSLLEELLGESIREVQRIIIKLNKLKRGCYGQYTQEQMLAAIQSYQCGLMGLNAAAKLFNIPRATLRRKVEGLPVVPGRQVPPQPGSNTADGSPQPPQPSASVGRPPIQPKQVDIKREQLSPRDRPSPHPQPQPHPQAPTPSNHPHPHPQAPTPTSQLPRRSAPAQMRPPGPSSPGLPMPPQPAAPPPEVCLRWNSYHSNMQATFPSLLNNEQFVDVTLACEGHSIKCHKVMLSACSSYFEELLSQNPCQHPIVLMKDLRFWEVQALVDFMYRGEVNVTQDKLPSLLAAAEALQIKGLAGPATNSHDGESPRGSYDDPLRRRKRRMQMPDPNELLHRNPVGRPRIHPKVPQRPQAPPLLQSSMTPRIQIRPEQQLQRPVQVQLDDGPPAQRMKHSPPTSPAIKLETLETDLSNDSLDKLRYDVGDSGGSGDGSNHGDALVDLSQGRFSINNGLQPDRNRDHAEDLDNDQDDERHLDDDDDREADRGQDHGRNQMRDHDMGQDNEQDEDHDMDQDQDNDQDRDNEQGLAMGVSEDDQDIHSSDEDQYDNEPSQDSRQQGDPLSDHLLGRL